MMLKYSTYIYLELFQKYSAEIIFESSFVSFKKIVVITNRKTRRQKLLLFITFFQQKILIQIIRFFLKGKNHR